MDARTAKAHEIVRAVAEHYGLDSRAMLAKDGRAVVARVRHLAVYLVRRELSFSYPELGKLFHRDQSSMRSADIKVKHNRDLLQLAENTWNALFPASISSAPRPVPPIGTRLRKDTGWPATSWIGEYRGIVDDHLVLRREGKVEQSWDYFLEPRSDWDHGCLKEIPTETG